MKGQFEIVELGRGMNARIAASLLLVASLSLAGCGEGEPEKPVDRNEIIEFVMDDVTFRVRRKYMISIGRGQSDDEIASAKMWALLPDFEGHDKTRNHVEFYETLDHGRRLRILLGVAKQSRPENLRDTAKRDGSLTNPDFHGLQEYTDDGNGHKHYFPATEQPATFHYLCRLDGPSPSCFGSFHVENDIWSTTSFAYQYLPMWQEIHGNVRLIVLAASDFESN